MNARARRARAVVTAVTASVLLAGCGLDLEDLPAPGAVSGPVYRVRAQFEDVQNLSDGAKVKIGGVVAGEVESIGTHDYRAVVTLSIEKKFALYRDARLQIRFSTPLGDQFVSVVSPGHHGRGRLADGAVIGLRATSSAPGIEDTFSALSTLLNHGGLDNLQTIATELTTALHGRGSTARDALAQVQRVVHNLDRHRADLDRAIDNVARISTILAHNTPVIEQALDVLPSTLDTLTADTARVRTLLTKIGQLGDTVEDLLSRSESALLGDLDNLRPTLDELTRNRDILVPTFTSLITLGERVRRAAPGDYLNTSTSIRFLLDAQPARPQRGGIVRSGAEPDSAGAVRELLIGGLR